MALTIKIDKMRDLSEKNQKLIIRTCEMATPVLNWRVWEERIMRQDYREDKGKSGAHILSLIKTGADDPSKNPDGDIDLDITGFFRLSSTIGYTYLNSYRTWVNRRFLDKFSEAELFGHIMHELMHRAFGFTHRIHKGSVPYVVGYVSRDSFQEYYKLNTGKEMFASFMENEMQPLLQSQLKIEIVG